MTFSKLIPLCLLLILTAAPALAQGQAADDAAIHALLDHVEEVFATGDIEGAMTAFTSDAAILPDDGADIVGFEAIRATYADMIRQFTVVVDFDSKDIVVAGDLAYEQGTYVFRLTDKASGTVVLDARPRYVHIFKRQNDGSWKTWRLITNTPAPGA